MCVSAQTCELCLRLLAVLGCRGTLSGGDTVLGSGSSDSRIGGGNFCHSRHAWLPEIDGQGKTIKNA